MVHKRPDYRMLIATAWKEVAYEARIIHSVLPTSLSVVSVFNFIFKRGNVEVNGTRQRSHTSSSWRGQDLNLGSLAPEPVVSATKLKLLEEFRGLV